MSELLKTNEPEQQNNTFWFPTPENPGKREYHTSIRTRTFTELNELKVKEKLNPTDSAKLRRKILERLDWTDTLLTETEKRDILVEHHDTLARHRMDIEMNTEFEVKPTPKEEVIHIQNPPVPTHLKEDLIVELVLMHKYRIITVLTFSKYACLFFGLRNPNRNFSLRLDFKEIKALFADDYTTKNHPVSTLSDAAQHLTGESRFYKLD